MAKIIAQSTARKRAGKNVSIYMTVPEHRALVRVSQKVKLSYSAIVRCLFEAYSLGEISPAGLPTIEKAK